MKKIKTKNVKKIKIKVVNRKTAQKLFNSVKIELPYDPPIPPKRIESKVSKRYLYSRTRK